MTVFDLVQKVLVEQAMQRAELLALNELLTDVLRAVAPDSVEASPALGAIAARSESMAGAFHGLADRLETLANAQKLDAARAALEAGPDPESFRAATAALPAKADPRQKEKASERKRRTRAHQRRARSD